MIRLDHIMKNDRTRNHSGTAILLLAVLTAGFSWHGFASNQPGDLDLSFAPGAGPNNEVWRVALQPDGKMVIGGSFTTVNGTARSRIARLNSDGSLDSSFNPYAGANAEVADL